VTEVHDRQRRRVAEATSAALVQALLDLLRPEVERLVNDFVTQRLISFRPRQPDPWLDVADASTYLRLTPAALRARIRRGTIPAHRDGSRWLLDRRELDAHLHGEAHRPASREAATMPEVNVN
jgi:excisionase family DNA binding protein